MSAVHFEVHRTDGVLRVLVGGYINEDCDEDLTMLLDRVDGDVTFDLSKIERINSIGLRKWIPRVVQLTQRRKAVFEALSYPMVMQANCVANLFGAGTVVSCMAPYYCDTCRTDRLALVKAEEITSTGGSPPARSCEICGHELEFDDLDDYFAFLKPRA